MNTEELNIEIVEGGNMITYRTPHFEYRFQDVYAFFRNAGLHDPNHALMYQLLSSRKAIPQLQLQLNSASYTRLTLAVRLKAQTLKRIARARLVDFASLVSGVLGSPRATIATKAHSKKTDYALHLALWQGYVRTLIKKVDAVAEELRMIDREVSNGRFGSRWMFFPVLYGNEGARGRSVICR